MQSKISGTVTHLWVGKAQWQNYDGRDIFTGAHKNLVDAITVDVNGACGDEQGNLKVHGGPEKALLLYTRDDYEQWTRDGYEFGPGNFFENITIDELRTSDIHLADTLHIGEVTVQVSQIRRPCTTLAHRWNMKELPRLVQSTGRSGFYVRVLTPGTIRTNDPVTLVQREPGSVDLPEVNRVMNIDRTDARGIRALIDAPGMPPRWVQQLQRRLSGYVTDDTDRLGE
ncbi:MOSC domain-containing protein [Brevibacterium paucivorans]